MKQNISNTIHIVFAKLLRSSLYRYVCTKVSDIDRVTMILVGTIVSLNIFLWVLWTIKIVPAGIAPNDTFGLLLYVTFIPINYIGPLFNTVFTGVNIILGLILSARLLVISSLLLVATILINLSFILFTLLDIVIFRL